MSYTKYVFLAGEVGFAGGAAVIMDVETGEILALSSFPEYDPNVLTGGSDKKTIGKYLADKGTPFLNRAVGGLYAPGSTVKPFFGIAALNEGIITPEKQILSQGQFQFRIRISPNCRRCLRIGKLTGGLISVARSLFPPMYIFMKLAAGMATSADLVLRDWRIMQEDFILAR